MIDDQIQQLTQTVDRLGFEIMMPLRTSKQINHTAMNELEKATAQIAELLKDKEEVSKELVGRLYFIFTSMLAEALHARQNREEIELIAWNYVEKLEKIFGPHFGKG
jgi:hypothetical protein